MEGNTLGIVPHGLTRKDALAFGLPKYKGKTCKHGHVHSLRHTASSRCIECRAEARLLNTTEEQKKQQKERSRRHYIRTKEAYAVYLCQRGGCCEICGGRFPSAVYDLHHVDPASKEGHCNLRGSWDWRAKAEGNKCAMLCANCHRMEHAALREGRTLLPPGYTTPDGSVPVIEPIGETT